MMGLQSHTANKFQQWSPRIILFVLSVVVVTLTGCGGNGQPENEVISVTGGTITGTTSGFDETVRVYKGIPYAAAPVRGFRWQPPQPVEPWEGTREAATFSPACTQLLRDVDYFYGPGADEMSEDCLYVNVWTAAAPNESNPVMVWLHPGGFSNGTGSDERFDGTLLAGRGVVLVSINYRLGPAGFLAHPLLSGENEHNSSGNYGILDQIAALDWIRTNIAAFGGNPESVTIFGASAGASSVAYLMASPLAKGLFHRAIAQSTSSFTATSRIRTPSLHGRSAEEEGELFVEAFLANATELILDLGEDVPLTLDNLRVIQAGVMLRALRTEGSTFSAAPNVDGWVLEDSVYETFAAGRQSDVPVIFGWTAQEGSGPMLDGVTWQTPQNVETYNSHVDDLLGDLASEHHQLYPVSTEKASQRAFVESYGDRQYGWSGWTGAKLMNNVSSRSYLYYFTRVPPGPNSESLGAYHSVDVAYVFGNFGLGTAPVSNRDYGDVDRQLGNQMMSYWINFAATGDPNGDGLPEWPAYSPDADKTMIFGDRPETQNSVRKAQLDLFDRYQANRRAAFQATSGNP